MNSVKPTTGFAVIVVILVLEVNSRTLAGSIQHCRYPEEAPAWAVAYGKEFWRRPNSAARPQASASQTATRISSSIDLGTVMERVSHAWVFDGKSPCATVNAQAYTASFAGHGFRISPHLPGRVGRSPLDIGTSVIMRPSMEIQEPLHWLAGIESSPRIVLDQRRPEARPALPELEATFRTVSVRRGNQVHYVGGQTTPAWAVLGDTAQSSLEPSSGLIEHHEARAEGIAVTWVFNKPVLGTGALAVEAELAGLKYAGQTARGHHFADASGTARLCVGQVSVVDSSGGVWEVPAKMRDDGLLVTVPEEVLLQAVFPLAIDPLISAEFGMDQPVIGPAQQDQSIPAVGSDGKDYLVVWADYRAASSGFGRYEAYGARVTAEGTVLDPTGFVISRQPGLGYQVASDGKQYFVVWASGGVIRGVRVSAGGIVLDSPELFISETASAPSGPALASNGNGYLVVWTSRQSVGSPNDDVFGSRVTSDGVVLDRPSIRISAAIDGQYNPAVASNGKDYFAVWTDYREYSKTDPMSPGTYVYGARIRSDGAVLDPDGIRISSALPRVLAGNVASDGNDYLAVWDFLNSNAQSGVEWARIGGDGAITNSGRIAESSGAIAVVPTAARSYLVFWAGQLGLYGSEVRLDGVVGIPFRTPSNSVRTPVSLVNQRALASNGSGFLLVWTGGNAISQTGYDIFGIMVSAVGQGATGKDLLISTSANRQRSPAVASNGDNALVVWEDDRNLVSSSTGLYGTRIGPDGRTLDMTGILIATAPALHGFDVTANGTNWLVVWSKSKGGNVNGSDLFGTRLDASGSMLDPAPFLISTSSGDLAEPSTASNGTDFLVVWQDDRNRPANIYGARVSDAGTVLDQGGIAITRAATPHTSVVVASDGKDYLAVWRESRSTRQSTPDIYGSRIDSAGRVLDPDGIPIGTAVNTLAPAAVTFNGNSYLVVWEDWRNFKPGSALDHTLMLDIYGTWVSRSGVVSHTNGFPICTADGRQAAPAVAANGPDFQRTDVLVVWADGRKGAVSGSDIYGTRISEGVGVVDGPGFVINAAYSDQHTPSVAYRSRGQFFVLSQTLRSGTDRVAGNLISVFENVLLRQNKAILSWLVEPGRTYRVQFKNDLSVPTWTELSGDLTAANGIISTVDETSAGVRQRFYRLVRLP